MRYARNAYTYLELLQQRANHHNCMRVDIATFRLGSHPDLPQFLETLTAPKLRLLIGVNGREDTDTAGLAADACLAVAEEMICKMGKRLEARARPGCHIKGAYLRFKNPKQSFALLGSANFCTGLYDEFVVPVTGEPADAFAEFFGVLWNASAVIEPTPLTISVLKARKF